MIENTGLIHYNVFHLFKCSFVENHEQQIHHRIIRKKGGILSVEYLLLKYYYGLKDKSLLKITETRIITDLTFLLLKKKKKARKPPQNKSTWNNL